MQRFILCNGLGICQQGAGCHAWQQPVKLRHLLPVQPPDDVGCADLVGVADGCTSFGGNSGRNGR